MLAKFPVDVELVREQFGFPVVVKMLSGTQGKGVFLSRTQKEFSDLISLVEITNPTTNLIIQEFVETSFGRDVRVLTVGGRAIAAMKRSSGSDEFRANYSLGGLCEPLEITAEIEWLASETSRILGLDIAGVDLLFAGEHFKVCEVNSSPDFEGLEQCCQVDIAETVYYLVHGRPITDQRPKGDTTSSTAYTSLRSSSF